MAGEAFEPMHYQEWGEGPPVLALHGLGLESSSFTGLAEAVAGLGLAMLAADLPGFGLTPAPERPLTPATLAEPVLELAGRLEEPPLVMGMSLGARVALEAALTAPERFRGVVMMAPPFPQRRHRWTLRGTHLFLNPEVAKRLPIELAWPLLKRTAERLETRLDGHDRHDWFLRSSRRTIYYMSCPATRWAFVSAARELATEPAEGPDGLWTRVSGLAIPAAFVWGGKDRIIGTGHVPDVEALTPGAHSIHVPCAGHFDNGPHFVCMEQGAIEGIRLVEAEARRGTRRKRGAGARRHVVACLVGGEGTEPRLEAAPLAEATNR